MALTATVSTASQPFTLTVTSDRRKFAGNVTVTAVGETASAPYAGQFPVTVSDSSGRVWTLTSDDGTTAVYTG
jgi:hypothetical protein